VLVAARGLWIGGARIVGGYDCDTRARFEARARTPAAMVSTPNHLEESKFDLTATTDWAGVSVALANAQVDLAWMGPWGYILANADSGVRAIATAKYDGKPIYHEIVVCGPGSRAARARRRSSAASRASRSPTRAR
jgi:hypothetical protein